MHLFVITLSRELFSERIEVTCQRLEVGQKLSLNGKPMFGSNNLRVIFIWESVTCDKTCFSG